MHTLTDHELKQLQPENREIVTANGAVKSRGKFGFRLKDLDSECIPCTVLPNTPDLLSLGDLVISRGFSFFWEPNGPPCMITPSGKVMELLVQNKIPVLHAEDNEAMHVL